MMFMLLLDRPSTLRPHEKDASRRFTNFQVAEA